MLTDSKSCSTNNYCRLMWRIGSRFFPSLGKFPDCLTTVLSMQCKNGD